MLHQNRPCITCIWPQTPDNCGNKEAYTQRLSVQMNGSCQTVTASVAESPLFMRPWFPDIRKHRMLQDRRFRSVIDTLHRSCQSVGKGTAYHTAHRQLLSERTREHPSTVLKTFAVVSKTTQALPGSPDKNSFSFRTHSSLNDDSSSTSTCYLHTSRAQL